MQKFRLSFSIGVLLLALLSWPVALLAIGLYPLLVTFGLPNRIPFGLGLMGILFYYQIASNSLSQLSTHLNHYYIGNIQYFSLKSITHDYLWLLMFALALMIVSVFHYLNARFNHKLTLKDKHNNSELSQDEAIDDTASLLGMNQGKSVYLSLHDANSHTLTIGTTGSGKTTTILNMVQKAIDKALPLFYVDGKGDVALAKRIEQYAKEHGRPFYLFSMVGDSVKYNPLSEGGITSKKDRIIALRRWSEEHYRKIAESYLQTLFYLLDKNNIEVDLYSLSHFLDLKNLLAYARASEDPSLANMYHSLKENHKNITGLTAEIENLARSEIGHLFDTKGQPHLTLKKAYDENAIVYFCLQPLAFPQYAASLGALIINDLKSLFSEQLKSETKKYCYTIFDEFSVFAGDQVINLINQGRSAGVCAVLATQSLSDIKKAGGQAFLGQVLNNCNNFIIHRQNNPDDAAILADVVGTFETIKISHQIKDHNTTSHSVSSARAFKVHPETIKNLKLGEAVFVNKQQGTVDIIAVHKGPL